MRRGYLQKMNKNVWLGALLCGVMGLAGCDGFIVSICEFEKESPRLACIKEGHPITMVESSISLSKPVFHLNFRFPTVPTQTLENEENTLKGITFHFEQKSATVGTQQSGRYSLSMFPKADQGNNRFEYTISIDQQELNKFISGSASLVIDIKDPDGEAAYKTSLDTQFAN